MQIDGRQSLALPEVPKRPGVINCASYAQGVRVANVVIADISEELKHEDRFVWVGLFEPDETLLREIQEEFCLHDLAIEDAHDAHQRPKLEQYGKCAALQLEAGWKVSECRFEGEPRRLLLKLDFEEDSALAAHSAASFARLMTPASSAGGIGTSSITSAFWKLGCRAAIARNTES